MTGRVYTCMGKENVVHINSHRTTDSHLTVEPEEEAERVKNIIRAGAPCCIMIDYDGDVNVDVSNEFRGCKICKCGEITFEKVSSKVNVKRSMR